MTARPKAMTFWVRNILFLTAFVVLVLAEILLSLTNLNALVAQQALTISGYETKDDVQHLRIAADGILTSPVPMSSWVMPATSRCSLRRRNR